MPRVGLLLFASLFFGCAIGFLEPPKHEHRLEEAAAEEKARCAPEDPAESDPKLFLPSVIESVEPFYMYTSGNASGRDAHLRGARLHMKPPKGASSEWLERALQCRHARLVLGKTARTAKDEPYWLEDAWVEIEVHSDGAGFIVDLIATDVDSAARLLARARAFARN